jgi:hypothetical protein
VVRLSPIAALLIFPLAAGCGPAAQPAGSGAGTRRAAPEPDRPPAVRVLAEAGRLLAGMTRTAYRHETRFDEHAGIVETDCSGLAMLLLERSAPEHLASARRLAGRERLRACDFRALFAAAPESAAVARTAGWQRVDRLGDARPGDFLAWEQRSGRTTGHVVLLVSAPVQENRSLWRVEVIDSASSGHAGEQRGATGGVGRGAMWFESDHAGRPVAYRWRGKSSLRVEAPLIAAGRPVAMH